MPDKVFIDTNVLIYGYSEDEPDKRQQAIDCVRSGEAWISTQVLNETINVLKRKFSLSYSQIREAVQELSEGFPIVLVSVNTIEMALNLAERYQYSYFDSLILASALEAGCQILYSEDLQDGQRIENQLTIINPFS
ncbi:PIN domain-containing protein [Microcystis aeruginosa]|uniref:PIN domain-containing protein n=1 Tax=Microcystis aeruginosa FD4 TaxID=2686288 RepID=A0A857D8N1_MICAE|nr:PIN domain-containing protein [Microcystis aeruginosa]NCQ97900.1 PIN domain-containing protein [Microcystis aeruginosa L211-11]NCR29411.1 PIN domain-containing protein [Microcystis aeruginosa L211-101]QGZ91902.1 PIN domain-containing protein [Microcystis aeruginosa FD4]